MGSSFKNISFRSDYDAYNLIRMLHRYSHPGYKHTWLKVNETLRKGLSLAIESEMKFERDEIGQIYNDMKGGHWFGADDEWILRLACTSGNASAARSYLTWKGRKRFVWPKRDRPGARESKLDLLYEGREFPWNGETVTVTSFNDEAGTLTACSYTGGKVKHRYTLTPADLKAARTEAA